MANKNIQIFLALINWKIEGHCAQILSDNTDSLSSGSRLDGGIFYLITHPCLSVIPVFIYIDCLAPERSEFVISGFRTSINKKVLFLSVVTLP